MKKEKNKVGRPKLGDSNLKKNSIIMIEIAIIGLIVLIIGAIISFVSTKKLNAKVVNRIDYQSYSISTISAICKNANMSDGRDYSKCQFTITANEDVTKTEVLIYKDSEFKDLLTHKVIKSKKGSVTTNQKWMGAGFLYYETGVKSTYYVKVLTYSSTKTWVYDRRYELSYVGSSKGKKATIKSLSNRINDEWVNKQITKAPIDLKCTATYKNKTKTVGAGKSLKAYYGDTIYCDTNVGATIIKEGCKGKYSDGNSFSCNKDSKKTVTVKVETANSKEKIKIKLKK